MNIKSLKAAENLRRCLRLAAYHRHIDSDLELLSFLPRGSKSSRRVCGRCSAIRPPEISQQLFLLFREHVLRFSDSCRIPYD
jgi:hypothetical protein